MQQKCPALGVQCRACGRRNHFARVCRSSASRPRRPANTFRPAVREIDCSQPAVNELDCDEVSQEELLVATIENKKQKDWNVTMTVNSHAVKFKIDTGAQCNVISSKTYHSLSSQPLGKSKARLVAFG